MLGDVGDLGEHLGDGAGGQRFEDHGDGGQPGVVGDEEVPVGGGRRVIRRPRPPQRHREPGTARSTQADAGPLSPWRTISIVSSRRSGSH